MTDHYTREDLKKLRVAANVIGTEWEPPLIRERPDTETPELVKAVELL